MGCGSHRSKGQRWIGLTRQLLAGLLALQFSAMASKGKSVEGIACTWPGRQGRNQEEICDGDEAAGIVSPQRDKERAETTFVGAGIIDSPHVVEI